MEIITHTNPKLLITDEGKLLRELYSGGYEVRYEYKKGRLSKEWDTEGNKAYHFYDADICLQALSRGYKVSTINVIVKHESIGELPKNFDELRKVMFDKWNKRVDSWPISRLTKFHEPEAKDATADRK